MLFQNTFIPMGLTAVMGSSVAFGAPEQVSAEDELGSEAPVSVSKPIQSAELLHTAHTLGRGQVALHPLFLQSTVGVGRNIDIQFPTLGILDGPSLGLEYTALDTESFVLSVEPFFHSRSTTESVDEEFWGWSFKAVSSGATVRATLPQGSNRLNLATAAVYDSHIDRLAVPLEAEFDLVTSDRTVIQFGMGTDLANDLRGSGNLSWMVHWNHGWGRYRISLGTTVTHGQASGVWDRSHHLDSDPSEGLGLQPHVAMWWLLGGSSTPRLERPTGWHSGPSVADPDASEDSLTLRLPRMSYGLSYGLGVRYLSLVEVPDGVAPRLDLGVFEVRRAMDSSYRFGPQPARLDVQIDLAHAFWSEQATRWPRLPVCVYSTWLRPTRRNHSMALSSGVYTELGLDRFVRDEVLVRRPAAAMGVAGRIGREKHRRRVDSGLYLRVVAGVNLAPDPDHPHVTRYLRLGMEYSRLWGRHGSRGAQP